MNELMKDIDRVLIEESEIKYKVKELAKILDNDYKGKKPLFVGILKGAVIFFTDLIREMSIDVYIDFMTVSSYGNGTTSNQVELVKDLKEDVKNRDIIIIEDIVDTGNTLSYIKELLLRRGAKSVKIACLLDKKERREKHVEIDYACFDMPNEFVVGYGMDYAEKYRGLKDICVLKEEIYNKK